MEQHVYDPSVPTLSQAYHIAPSFNSMPAANPHFHPPATSERAIEKTPLAVSVVVHIATLLIGIASPPIVALIKSTLRAKNSCCSPFCDPSLCQFFHPVPAVQKH